MKKPTSDLRHWLLLLPLGFGYDLYKDVWNGKAHFLIQIQQLKRKEKENYLSDYKSRLKMAVALFVGIDLRLYMHLMCNL